MSEVGHTSNHPDDHISGCVSVYIHWPFCLSKCPYCDFNSHVAGEIDTEAWRKALLAELDSAFTLYQQKTGRSQPPILRSLFFGGGTPSLMPASLIEALIDRATNYCRIDGSVEITAEANPTSAEAAKIADFVHAGVNRLSLGIQSLHDDGLAFLGREHSATEALAALDRAQSLLKHVSADIIYGLPDQTEENWTGQLSQLLNRGLSHLSAYQLTIEPGTVFHTRHRKGEVLTAPSDEVAQLYLMTEHLCEQAGLPAYEISNYAEAGSECRHNLGYWRSEDWLAVGPGGHAQFWTSEGRLHYENRKSPSGWLDDVLSAGHARGTHSIQNPRDVFETYWMMGLRLADGIAFPDHIPSLSSFALNQDWLTIFKNEGWLEAVAGGIRPTAEGRLRLNSMLTKLLDD